MFDFIVSLLIIHCMTTLHAHRHTAYNHDRNGLGSNPDWQSLLHNDVKINELSLPGTHDTIADGSPPVTKIGGNEAVAVAVLASTTMFSGITQLGAVAVKVINDLNGMLRNRKGIHTAIQYT